MAPLRTNAPSEQTRPATGQALSGTKPPVDWITEEALLLAEARRRRTPVTALSLRRPGVTLVDAYRIQAAGIVLPAPAGNPQRGQRPVGHKVGLTSEAMQLQMGVDEPDSGVLLDYMLVPDGGRLAASEFLAPRVEAEIAFRLGADLPGGADRRVAQRAVAQVLLALEVIDTRYGHWGIGLIDSVADNASCARVVTGLGVSPGTVEDLQGEQIVLDVDGAAAATGPGRAVLGDPAAALVWLARRLEQVGSRLRAGDLVLAGAVHASLPLRAGTGLRARSAHLPPVHLHVT